MLKKLDICGIQIDNHTVQEAILLAETFLNDTVLNTIETIDLQMLDLAAEEETIGQCMEMLDLAVIGEKEILVAAGETFPQRIKETVEHDFFQEFLKRVIRNQKCVFLLGNKTEEVEQLEAYLKKTCEKLQIAGKCAIEEKSGDSDSVINEINGVSPDVIFSILPSPAQENFLLEHKSKLNVKIWYGLGDEYRTYSGWGKFLKRMKQIVRLIKLRIRLHNYQNKDEDK